MAYDEGIMKERFTYPNPEREQAEIEKHQAEEDELRKPENAEKVKGEDIINGKSGERFEELMDLAGAVSARSRIKERGLEGNPDWKKKIPLKFREWLEKAEGIIALSNTRRRLEADPEKGEVPREAAAFHFLPTFGDIAGYVRGKNLPLLTVEKLRKEITDHYKVLYFAGRLAGDKLSKHYTPQEPAGTSYRIQRIFLEKMGVRLEEKNVKFFNRAEEEKIPLETLRNALEIDAGSTWDLFKYPKEIGLYRHLDKKEMNAISGLACLGKIIDDGEWLNFSRRDFFKEEKINLFKINRRLSENQLWEILRDLLKDANPGKISQAVVEKLSQPLTPELIRKYGLEELVKEESNEIRKADEYLRSGKNAAESRIGRIIFVPNMKERLPAPLSALDANPPLDPKTGKPSWEKVNGYFEIGSGYILGYLRKERAGILPEKVMGAAERKEYYAETNELGGWIRVLVRFREGFDGEFFGAFKNDWLKVTGKQEKPLAPERKKEKKEEVAV